MQKSRREITIAGKTVLIDLDLSKFSQKHIWDRTANGGLYEIEVVRALERALKPGDTFVDVGAHVGYFSMIGAALVGEEGRVIAVEPEFSNGENLLNNRELNRFEQIRFYRNAAGADEGQRRLRINLDNDGGHAFWDVGEHPFNKLSKSDPHDDLVVMLKLDRLQLENVKAIKIDVEGSEYDVLFGSQELLKANPQAIVICEINRFALDQMGTSEPQLRQLMHGLGYKAFYLPTDQDAEPEEMPFGYTIRGQGCVFNIMFKK